MADLQSSGEMWDWHPSKTAMEFLWRSGELAICHRKNFQKCFDLADRVIPDAHRLPELEDAEIVDWACGEALDRLAFATPGEIARFWDLITIDEAKEADEAFITSASTFVMPVVEIDGVALGEGVPGRVAPRLREIYLEESLKKAV